MARASVAEHTRLSLFLMRRGLRRATGRASNLPLLPWRMMSGKSDRMLIAPQDLRTADATRAGEIYAGRFAFAGKVVVCDGRSPFEMMPPSEEWAVDAARVRLAAPSARRRFRHHARQCARAGRRMDHAAGLAGMRSPGGPKSLARRVISWLSQAP